MITDITEILEFLPCATPDSWITEAVKKENLPLLLIDHAQCEKKAASNAMSLMYRYVDRFDLLKKMTKIAREELIHFEQVITIMKERDIAYEHLSAAKYAAGLISHVRKEEPNKLIDHMIIGAFVEARSCERFSCLIPHLDEELSKFYASLLKSEARHFKDYLRLAEKYAEGSIQDRIHYFAEIERNLIESNDDEFRFHSGPPVVPDCVKT